jgi:hypothetical protein
MIFEVQGQVGSWGLRKARMLMKIVEQLERAPVAAAELLLLVVSSQQELQEDLQGQLVARHLFPF